MGGLLKFVILLVVLYIIAGAAIYGVQAATGADCKPGQVHAVRAKNPDIIMSILMWAPSIYRQVIDGNTDIGEFMSPTKCVAVPPK